MSYSDRKVCCIRFGSIVNQYIDCLVHFFAEDYEKVVKALYSGLEEFYEECCEAYGECIERALIKEGVVWFVIEYGDYYEEDGNDYPKQEWLEIIENAKVEYGELFEELVF
jgi:hypothetical protein